MKSPFGTCLQPKYWNRESIVHNRGGIKKKKNRALILGHISYFLVEEVNVFNDPCVVMYSFSGLSITTKTNLNHDLPGFWFATFFAFFCNAFILFYFLSKKEKSCLCIHWFLGSAINFWGQSQQQPQFYTIPILTLHGFCMKHMNDLNLLVVVWYRGGFRNWFGKPKLWVKIQSQSSNISCILHSSQSSNISCTSVIGLR